MRTPEQLFTDGLEHLSELRDLQANDAHVFHQQSSRIRMFFDVLIELTAQRSQPGVDALVHRLVADSAELLACQQDALGHWLYYTHVYAGRNREEDFMVACRARSGYEIACTLYRGTAAEAALAELDIAELDETLAEQAPEHGQVVLPPQIPATHTWWRFRTS
jgi:hypothetical protein